MQELKGISAGRTAERKDARDERGRRARREVADVVRLPGGGKLTLGSCAEVGLEQVLKREYSFDVSRGDRDSIRRIEGDFALVSLALNGAYNAAESCSGNREQSCDDA